MSACTFFGHRDCPDSIKPKLRETLIDLISNYNVDMFYVGNQGCFDTIVRAVLRDIQLEYQQIRYAVVLAYMPARQSEYDDYSDTMLPEGIEVVHPRYAISWRNNWLLKQSDYVVTYITRSWGGAAQYAQRAVDSGRSVLNLAEEVCRCSD